MQTRKKENKMIIIIELEKEQTGKQKVKGKTMIKNKISWQTITCYMITIFLNFTFSASCQDLEKENTKPLLYQHCDQAVSTLMKELHQMWIETDGEAVLVIGENVFWALLLDPAIFYNEFSDDTIHYQRFKDGLDYVAFTNWRDTTTDGLERLRIVAIDRLVDLTYLIDTNHLKIHEEMIERLRQVKCKAPR